MAMSKYGYHHPLTCRSHITSTLVMKYFKFVKPQTNLIIFLVLQPAVITHMLTHMQMDTHTHTHTNIHMQMDTQQQTDKGTYTVRLYQYGFFDLFRYQKFYATTNILKSTDALKLHRPVLLANISQYYILGLPSLLYLANLLHLFNVLSCTYIANYVCMSTF